MGHVAERTPETSPSDYQTRRRRVAAALGEGSALLVHGGRLRTRSNDTEFPFRPGSDFHYMTGLEEPGGVMLLRPGRDPEFTLFVRPRDRDAEIWNGRRLGPERAAARVGADAAHPLNLLPEELPRLLDGVERVHIALGEAPSLDRRVMDAIAHLRRRNRYGTTPPRAIYDAREVMGEERLVKDEAALASLRKAVELTIGGHREAAARLRPGQHEFEFRANLEHHFLRHGSSGPGYGSIVGGGANATILHYVDAASPLVAGDLLLVDAGAEWEYFSGDLTRCYPVDGRFSPAQRAMYEVVLAANGAGLAAVRPGSSVRELHDVCVKVLAEGMRELGLLDRSLDEILEKELYKDYYMHRTSHWLGVDVHDVGAYTLEGSPRPLAPGYVLTVEPGLYVAEDDESAPAEMRGVGIRIEDDVLVTADGHEVLTAAAPRTVAAVEAMVGRD